MGKSNNKDSFEKQLDELQELGNLAAACAKLLTNASASSLDADAYISAYSEASGGGAKLGPLYILKLVVAQGQKLLLYGKYKEYCKAFLASSEPIQALSQSLGEKDAAKHCALEVENRMLASLRAIPASELSLLKPGKAPRDLGSEALKMIECLDLAGAIEDACGKERSWRRSWQLLPARWVACLGRKMLQRCASGLKLCKTPQTKISIQSLLCRGFSCSTALAKLSFPSRRCGLSKATRRECFKRSSLF